MCSINTTFHKWSWSLWTEQGKVDTFSRFRSSIDPFQQASSVVVNSTSFTVLRVSISDPEVVMISSLAIAQHTMPYNINVNISIMATLYGQLYTKTNIIVLHYGESPFDYTNISGHYSCIIL